MSGKFAGLGADVSKASRMEIINPLTDVPLVDGVGTVAYIDLLSIDSDAGRALGKQRSQAFQRKMRSGRNRFDDDDPIEDQVETLVALTTGWRLLDLEGNPIEVEFSKQNAKELYETPDMGWLRRQAFAFINAEANFIKRSPKTSTDTASKNSG